MKERMFRKENLCETLKQTILTLDLSPGSDLDEATLSKEYGMSRTPIREVLQQLAGEGYVLLSKNRGARVSDMSHKVLRDFFLTAPMIYSSVMRLAAQNARPSQIDDLKAAQLRFREALRKGNAKDRTLANNRFHAITGEMADNPYLTASLQRLLIDHARIGMTFYRPRDARMIEKLGAASDQHEAMIAAIEANDEDAAAQLALDHWNLSRNQIEMFVTPEGLDARLDSPFGSKSA